MSMRRTPHTSSRLVSLLARLGAEERGTSITEFVIGLPVFLLLFSGILTLYELNHTSLMAKAAASADLWDYSVRVQTSARPVHMMPVAGGIDAAAFHHATGGSWVDLAWDGVDAGAGMVFESGWKTMGINAIQNIGSTPPPTINLANIVAQNTNDSKTSFSYNLINDQVRWAADPGEGGVMGIAGMILDTVGARPAVAAGIRYGIGQGKAELEYNSGKFGGSKAQVAYHVAAPPQPTTRTLGVGMTWMETRRVKAYKDAILPFTMMPVFAPASGLQGSTDICPGSPSGSGPDVDGIQDEVQQCVDRMQAWAECADRTVPGFVTLNCGRRPNCSAGNDEKRRGQEMLDCLRNAGPGGAESCGC